MSRSEESRERLSLTSRAPLSRRELLARGGVIGAAGAAGSCLACGAHGENGKPAAKLAPGPMPKTVLGRTGMQVSRLACGGSWDVDAEVLAHATALGVNYMDTAESYRNGQSEIGFGEYLQAIGATGHSAARKKIWLVTKSHNHMELERALPPSLERLKQDYVDVVYMHQIADPRLPTSPDVKAMAERLKKSGKTRFFGFSCHDEPLVACLNAAADSGFIDVIMFRYDHHYYKQDDLNRAIDRCTKANIGLVAMKTLVGGMTLPDQYNPFRKRGLNQFQASIKAVAADERIHAICSEMTNVDMVAENSAAIASKLTAAEADAIQEHARLVSHLWCRGCERLCRPAAGAGSTVAVADSLRFLMYHDHYGKKGQARELFAGLPPEQRDLKAIETGNWRAAEDACPYHVPLATLMARVRERLA